MYINELIPESEVTLTCKVGKDKRGFLTKVVGPYEDKNAILVEAIRYNGVVVNFNIADMILESQVDKTKAVMFKVDSITSIRIKNQTYHLITSASDATAVNRRNGIRVPLGVPCKLKFGPKRTEIDCYVHDISSTGISFTIKQEAEIARGDELSSTFTYGEERTTFKVFATAVRMQKNDKNGYLTVGAKFKSTSNAIDKFIMKLQREEAQRRRGY